MHFLPRASKSHECRVQAVHPLKNLLQLSSRMAIILMGSVVVGNGHWIVMWQKSKQVFAVTVAEKVVVAQWYGSSDRRCETWLESIT